MKSSISAASNSGINTQHAKIPSDHNNLNYKQMKRYITKLLLSIMALGIFSACSDDFLDVIPKGSIIAEKTSDYNLLLNNLSLLNISGQNIIFKMSPEVCGVEPFYSSNSFQGMNAFRWEDEIYQPDDDMDEISNFMTQVYTYNKVINEVLDSQGDSEELKKSLRAEALAGRAWNYFMLINFFGAPYNPATASNEPGYPIIERADVTQSEFTRASVQEVYDFILNDLQEAVQHLPPTTHRLRMSQGAALGLLGKTQVFMGNYQEAVINLENAISSLIDSPIPNGLYNYNNDLKPGRPLAIGLFGPALRTAPNNIEAPYAKQLFNPNGFTGSEVLLSPEYSALYESHDLRLFAFFSNAPFNAAPFGIPGVYRRRGSLASAFGVSMPDTYLLLAEAKARTGDLAGAVEVLEFLRKHRMPQEYSQVPQGLDQETLIHFIIDERMREFAVDGHEWFTTRRLSVDPLFQNRTYTHTVFENNGNIKETHTLRPERLTLRFNQKILSANPTMKNNQ